jgi:hypothetical protein
VPTSVPTVMVSSTFYDLRQVRANISEFLISEVGFSALLSESNSFPIDPSVDTIENCKRRVENDADVLVLIIGGRYGHVDDRADKSITNLEYLAARAKGIPIYAFVMKSVLSILPVWKQNPKADFFMVVDSPKVFEFIDEVRSVHKVWMHEFETAQDITSALRVQFAHLAFRGVQWFRKFHGNKIAKLIESLSPLAAELVLQKPLAWEYRLFFQVILDEIEKCSDIRREYQLGLALGSGESVAVSNLGDWAQSRISEIQRIANSLNILVDQPVKDAMGPPGQPGDEERIAFVARQIGLAYKEALQWVHRIRVTSAPEDLTCVLNEMARWADGIISSIEQWPKDSIDEIQNVLPRLLAGENIQMTLCLNIELGGDLNRFQTELQNVIDSFDL